MVMKDTDQEPFYIGLSEKLGMILGRLEGIEKEIHRNGENTKGFLKRIDEHNKRIRSVEDYQLSMKSKIAVIGFIAGSLAALGLWFLQNVGAFTKGGLP